MAALTVTWEKLDPSLAHEAEKVLKPHRCWGDKSSGPLWALSAGSAPLSEARPRVVLSIGREPATAEQAWPPSRRLSGTGMSVVSLSLSLLSATSKPWDAELCPQAFRASSKMRQPTVCSSNPLAVRVQGNQHVACSQDAAPLSWDLGNAGASELPLVSNLPLTWG